VYPITAYLRGKERGSDNTALILLYLLKALICSVLIPPPTGTCMHNDCSFFFPSSCVGNKQQLSFTILTESDNLNKSVQQFLFMLTASVDDT